MPSEQEPPGSRLQREALQKGRNPWASGGQATRAEVREIFARHAKGEPELAAAEPERRKAMPTFLLVPARIWQILPLAGKIAAAGVLLALAAVVALLLPPALETASENRESQRRAAAANRESIRRNLVQDQRPRSARVVVPVTAAGFAKAVARDFERRVRAGDLEGPAGRTTCRPIRPQREPGVTAFTCLAERGAGRGVYRDRVLVSGYRFRGRANRATGAAVWCKENPQPLHPDQEEFVVVPLARACTG
jgi:hypothetical protein